MFRALALLIALAATAAPADAVVTQSISFHVVNPLEPLFTRTVRGKLYEPAAGLHGNVDGLIAGAYSHTPSAGILLSVITQDTPQALLNPYIYFAGTPQARAQDMYNLAVADPAVVSEDTQLANLTPSGEI